MEYPNWFEQSAKNNFEVMLEEFKGKPNLSFLQIGAFTGDASVWMLDNILTNKSSFLMDVDTWGGSNEKVHAEMDFEDVFNVYVNKTDKYVPQSRYYKGKSSSYFLSDDQTQYDFIYIDGDHTARGVIADATMAFERLKYNGILAFDDYTWMSDDKNELHMPKAAIHFFFWAYQENLEILVNNNQFWVRKI